jgi:hypothetical protein
VLRARAAASWRGGPRTVRGWGLVENDGASGSGRAASSSPPGASPRWRSRSATKVMAVDVPATRVVPRRPPPGCSRARARSFSGDASENLEAVRKALGRAVHRVPGPCATRATSRFNAGYLASAAKGQVEVAGGAAPRPPRRSPDRGSARPARSCSSGTSSRSSWTRARRAEREGAPHPGRGARLGRQSSRKNGQDACTATKPAIYLSEVLHAEWRSAGGRVTRRGLRGSGCSIRTPPSPGGAPSRGP